MKPQKWLKEDWLSILVLIVPFIYLAMYWDRFPDQVPMHWNIKGEVDSYSSKAFGLLLAPVLNILIYLLSKLLPYIDPRRENYPLFRKTLRIIILSLNVFFLIIFFVTCFASLGYAVDVPRIIVLAVSGLLLIIGNYMGTVRHNYMVGVRTPWTLASEEVWKVTHRFTGRLWVAGSLLMILLAIFFFREWIFIPIILVLSLLPILYSYIQYKRLNNHTTHQ